jgi:hypothetical protein
MSETVVRAQRRRRRDGTPGCTVLHSPLHRTTLHRTTLHRTTLHRTVLRCAVLHRAALHFAARRAVTSRQGRAVAR